jgi:hypothetical protein
MIKKTIIVCSIFITSGMLNQINASSDWPSAVQSDSANEKQFQSIEKRYHDHQQWFIHNVYPLSKLAEQNGIQATEEEISVQEKSFKAMFPGKLISSDENRVSVIAKKYSETVLRAPVSPGMIQYEYTRLQSEYPEESMPPQADIKPILEMKALLHETSVRNEIEKYNKQMHIKFNEGNIKSSQTWEISDLMIQAPGNNCLVKYKDGDSCFLTVGQFNRYLRYKDITKILSIDGARRRAIQEIIRDVYIADVARKQLAVGNDTVISQARQNWMKWKTVKRKYKDLGTPVKDSISLKDAYNTYYDALFSERVTPFFSIIGSSDSLYMDSIFRAFKNEISGKDGKIKGQSKTTKNGSDLPWSSSQAGFLPREFDKYTDTMHFKEVSGIIRMPYGFFIIRLDSVQKRPERRFEDAKMDLIYLATKRKWKNLDSMLVEKAYEIYKSNLALCNKPDTLKATFFLTPDAESMKNKKPIFEKDLERGLAVISSQLPLDISDSLASRIYASKNKKKIMGPIITRYGVWNFKVLDIKPSGGFLPFSFSKQRLIDSLVSVEVKFNLDTLWQHPDTLLDNIALGWVYSSQFFGINEFAKMNPDKGDALGDAKANLENEERNLKIGKGIQERNAELEVWLSKFTILYDKDHQGGTPAFQ